MSRDCIEIEKAGDALPCDCGSCEWRGPAADLARPDGAILTPGDPSPAGRCPDCGALAYLNRPEDRARDAGERAVALLRSLTDRNISNDAFCQSMADARALLASVESGE